MFKAKKELTTMNDAQLYHYISEMRQELFTLRLHASTDHVKDYSQFEKIRRSIAVALTYLTQRAKNIMNTAI